MDFENVPIDEAEGAMLAHSFRNPCARILNVHVVSVHHIAEFRDAEIETVTVEGWEGLGGRAPSAPEVRAV